MGVQEVSEGVTLPSGTFSPQQIGAAITPKIQELILLPTEKCNLRCTYCYEDFKIGKMSETTQQSIERFIERRTHDLSLLRLNWFGGEPLVAKEIVLRLSRYARDLCKERGVRFMGALTTNAYLLDRDLFENLLDAKQDFFQITLDGWGEQHDAVRKFANGRGTFERIWANLLQMKETTGTFEILLRVHVRRGNIQSLNHLMEELARNFGSDDRFRLDFEHVRDLGGAGGASVTDPVSVLEVEALEAGWRRLYRSGGTDRGLAGEDAGSRANDGGEDVDTALAAAKLMGESAGGQRREDIAHGGGYICYAAKPNSLLVRANGRIGKCTVALNDDRNDIGRINPDGTLSVDNDKLRPWMRGLSDLDPADLGCPWARMPKFATPAAQVRTPTPDRKEPNP